MNFQGKAGSLKFLKSLGLKVPDFKVITHDEFIAWGNQEFYHNILSEIKKGNIQNVTAAAEKFVRSVSVPPLNLSQENSYAVRSSASLEDSPDNSFAGIFETKLFVSDLPSALKEVWLSLFEPKSLQYCNDRGLPWSSLKMDIVIQEMVDGEKSGVLFQANPSGNISEQVIVAGYGLGQGIVDEETDTDRYVIENFEIKESFLENKKHFLSYDKKKIIKKEVPTDKQDISVLSQSEIEKILTASVIISTYTEHFMDVEFTIRHGELYLLQARPITTIPSKKQIHIFDNSNIAENYPGMTTPLTYSGLARGYSTNFKNLIKFMGFEDKDWNHILHKVDNLIGYWGGQIYYNLNNWYSVYALLPFGAEKAVASFNEMVGINTDSIIKIPERSFTARMRLILKILPRFLGFYLSGKKYHLQYKREFQGLYASFNKKFEETKTTFDVINSIQELDTQYLSIIKIPLFNDFFSSLLNFSCRRLAQQLIKGNGEQFYNDLLSNKEDLESSKAIYSLIELSEMVQKEPDLASYLETSHLPSERFSEFFKKLRLHFDRFGDRSQWEMKLEVPTARENPETTIKLILEYARAGMSRELQRQKEKEKSMIALKEFKKARFKHPLLYFLFRFQFKKCTDALAFREDSRFDRVRIKGISRKLILKLGALMVEKQWIEERDDLFYLTYEEIVSLSHDSFGTNYWKELIALRKKHLEEFSSLRLPDRILTNDLVSVKKFNQKAAFTSLSSIKGIPCSGGIVETECEVVKDLNYAPSLSGKILVAERTDPAWGYFFVGVKGIIIEKGSMLSHAAIISRELGIPCIINVKNATQIFKSGMKVKMNGDTGEIEIKE
ncbi:MAG: PEP/pyruvate-binding domain-containing protein [Bacteriovoracia bacterium]